MTKFPNPRTARAQALLAATASWAFIFWLFFIPLGVGRPYAIGGLLVWVALWFLTIVLAFRLKCPTCGKSVAIVQKRSQLKPDWSAGRKQLFPIEAITGMPEVEKCPHCGTELLFE
ncbi:hypothetical protein [Roseateles saccharophilus]|uniref:hypothetical protein n=1 Tax=Roseateles saccharophilus TaxID=304 RepID=UPI001048C45B|nr:hypothetical protein [Roseateles saccharophilus]MDG0831859.1 hypothetical protein [Roseateles saccharophilus]